MPRYAAFLRAINVGGHTVKMADLRASIQALGFGGVETFIASGNVVFDSPETNEGRLESTIERALEADLGYPVETFVRSMADVAGIEAREPFERTRSADDGRSVYVAFLDREPTTEAIGRLVNLGTDDDTFAVVGREAYWLRRGGIGTSKFSSGFLEKTLGMAATVRGLPTITRMVARYQ